MRVRVFALPWIPGGGGIRRRGDAGVPLGLHLLEVVQYFLVQEKTPVLVLVVTYREALVLLAGNRASRIAARPSAPDRGLSPEERTRYEALRSWSDQYSRRVGRPPYMWY